MDRFCRCCRKRIGALPDISALVFGADTWLAYPETFRGTASLRGQDPSVLYLRMCTLLSALRYHSDPIVAFGDQDILTLATITIVCRFWTYNDNEMAAGAMLLAGTALGSTYLFSYDLPFLVLPIFWLALDARRTGWLPWEKLIALGLWLAPLATRAAAIPLHVNLMPIASAILFWSIWRRKQAQPYEPAITGI
jgi:hypothetical protein